MTLHMIKLCVGAASVDDLAEWQKGRIAKRKRDGLKPFPYHTTYQTPKRKEELLEGGSLFWVMKGIITVRQRLVGFEDGHKEDGSACCLLLLDPELVLVKPVPRRAFQGWRYLSSEDAPEDLRGGARDGVAAMPSRLRKELADLGLI